MFLRLSTFSLYGFIVRMVLFLILWNTSGWANPTNPQVIIGSATFNNPVSGVLQVTVLSSYAVIQWDDFSIQNLETTQFIQPSANSLVINEVIGSGATMTAVDGTLTGNGQIWIINPENFFVGSDGIIEASSFLASTISLNVIQDHWWDWPNVASSSSFFWNQGTVRITGGDLILLCNHFIDDGFLEVATDFRMFIVKLQETVQEVMNEWFFRDSNSLIGIKPKTHELWTSINQYHLTDVGA